MIIPAIQILIKRQAPSSLLPPNVDGRNIYFFGDSITFGAGASDDFHRYSTLLTYFFNGTEVNHGISSSTLEKRIPINPLGSGINMIDRISDIPIKTSDDALLIFFFGMNDWGCNRINYTPINFIEDYQLVINTCYLNGWDSSQILILSPSYPLDAAFAFYADISGQPEPTRESILSFIEASQQVADDNDILHIDLYHIMEENNPSVLISEDGVHPNNTGHSLIANYIITITT